MRFAEGQFQLGHSLVGVLEPTTFYDPYTSPSILVPLPAHTCRQVGQVNQVVDPFLDYPSFWPTSIFLLLEGFRTKIVNLVNLISALGVCLFHSFSFH
jgi:hypothetical protein